MVKSIINIIYIFLTIVLVFVVKNGRQTKWTKSDCKYFKITSLRKRTKSYLELGSDLAQISRNQVHSSTIRRRALVKEGLYGRVARRKTDKETNKNDLNLRINFYLLRTFPLILAVFALFLLSLRFGQISSLAFFRWFTTTSDRNINN